MSNLEWAELVSSIETETATAGARRDPTRPRGALLPSARWPDGAAPQPQSRPYEWHSVRELPAPTHFWHEAEGLPLQAVDLQAQSRPKLEHCALVWSLMQFVHPALVGHAGVGAEVGAVGAKLGCLVALMPSWSGQHCRARQHGNIHATALGTKQHTAALSLMHV